MTLFRSPTTNFWSSTLNGSIDGSVQTITLNSTTGLRAPGVLIIDRQDSSQNNTPSAREVISYTGISGSDLTGVTRGFSSSTARTHSDGALIEAVMETGMWDNLISVVTVAFDGNGVLNSVISPMSISRAQITQLALSSVASISRAEFNQFALTSIASITALNIGSSLFAVSGASISLTHPAVASPNFRSHLTGVMSIANNTETAIIFNGTDDFVNPVTMHSTSVNPTRVTIPAGQGGIYLATAQVDWTDSTVGIREILFRVNGNAATGTSGINQGVPAQNTLIQQSLAIMKLVAGDYVECYVVQASGGSLNLRADATNMHLGTWFSLVKLSTL